MKRVLLVEDNESLGKNLQQRLSQEGYHVEWASTLSAARMSFRAERPALAVLDVMLPDGTGFELAKELFSQTTIPVIFLSAFSTAEYRLEGFDVGAVDYIPKPFHLRELLVRIDRALKHSPSPPPTTIQVGSLRLAPDSLSAQLSGREEIFMGKREFDLLQLLLSQAPAVVSREEIQRVVYGDESLNARTIDNSIVRLRQTLGEAGRSIRTVRGVGYQWVVSSGEE